MNGKGDECLPGAGRGGGASDPQKTGLSFGVMEIFWNEVEVVDEQHC